MLDVESLAKDWLDLSDVQWRGVALDHILQARPPIHSVNAQTSGASILRWFLHRVLPYPSFLTDLHWTATRLGVNADWLQGELATDSELKETLADCQYSGVFEGFLGPRWWRAGVAGIIADLTDGQPFNRTALRDGIRRICSDEPIFLTEERPVLAIDPKAMELLRVIEAEDAVRVSPDGWPTYADDAWASVADARANPDIAEIVLDQSQLEDTG